jgi:hypothetical protein
MSLYKEYNEEEPLKLKNWAEIVYNRLHVQGMFLTTMYLRELTYRIHRCRLLEGCSEGCR